MHRTELRVHSPGLKPGVGQPTIVSQIPEVNMRVDELVDRMGVV